MKRVLFSALVLLMAWDAVKAFYFRDNPVRSFSEGDEVQLSVNKLTSIKTLLPLDYYSLPFCRPKPIQKDKENLGQLLAGDRIQNSPYKIRMTQEKYCEQVCIANLGQETVDAIHKEYHSNWIVDNLPAASKVEDDMTITTRFWQGFPIGFLGVKDRKAYIHNHVNIEIMYHPVDEELVLYRVVRFFVEPFSIKHEWNEDESVLPVTIKNPIASCDHDISPHIHTNYDMVVSDDREPQEASGPVLFTYDVIWIEHSELQWSDRWEVYLTMDGAIPYRVHWFSIMSSLIVAILFSALLFIIWRRMVRDISEYRQAVRDGTTDAEMPPFVRNRCCCLETDTLLCICFCGILALFWVIWKFVVRASGGETATPIQTRGYGWRAVQADVFRPPKTAPMLLAVACGTGAQLLCTAALTILVSVAGVSPVRRGSLLIAILILFSLMGVVCGYVSSRFYKAFGGGKWKLCSIVAALGFPSLVLVIFSVIYKIAGISKSTYADGLKVWVFMVALWLGVITPLVFAGAYFGYRQVPIRFPIKPSATPRDIPGHPLVHNLVIMPGSIGLCGVLPFGALFVELYFMMASIWYGQFYYAFGFLSLVFVITTITCAINAVLFTYLQLRMEDYRWWWRSFSNGGAVAFYVFFYSFIFARQVDGFSGLDARYLYFGFMAVVSLGILCMMGFAGVCGSLWFTKMVFAVEDDQESDKPLVSSEVELQSGQVI